MPDANPIIRSTYGLDVADQASIAVAKCSYGSPNAALIGL